MGDAKSDDYNIFDDPHLSLTFHSLATKPSEKETNPKDVVGVRKAPMSVIPMGVAVPKTSRTMPAE